MCLGGSWRTFTPQCYPATPLIPDDQEGCDPELYRHRGSRFTGQEAGSGTGTGLAGPMAEADAPCWVWVTAMEGLEVGIPSAQTASPACEGVPGQLTAEEGQTNTGGLGPCRDLPVARPCLMRWGHAGGAGPILR